LWFIVLSAHLVKLVFQEFMLSVEVIIFGLEALVILLVLVELVLFVLNRLFLLCYLVL